MSKYTEMTEEELKILSNKKKNDGCYTQQALAAQKELWNRIHYEIDNTLEEHYDGCYDDGYKEIDVLSQQY